MILNIDHIGIAVADVDASNALFARLLGRTHYKTESVESEGVMTSFFQVNQTKIELVAATRPDSTIAKYIEKRSAGMHHIALEVDDIRAEMVRLVSEGFELLNETPKKGADNKLICFLHPKTTNGVLVELCQTTTNLNEQVSNFLDELNHPLRNEIEQLRNCILTANPELVENIKWNGPNYCFDNEDRITMSIQPVTTKQIQIIFHCGAKVQAQPKEKLIEQHFDILIWKTNDRAIATFKNGQDIENRKTDLIKIINEWIKVTR